VIVITRPRSAATANALAAGADECLTTPRQLRRLVSRVGTELRRHASRRRLARSDTGRAPEGPGQTVCIVSEVTIHKSRRAISHGNEKMALRQAKLEALVPGVIGEYLLSTDGRVSVPTASPRLEEVTGWKWEDVQQDATLALRSIHPDDLDRHIESIRESARTLGAWHDEFRVRHPSKGEIWIEGRSIPEREPGGCIRWYGFLRDVTEHKRTEQRLRASEQAMRALVHRREADVEEERRRIARELHDEFGQLLVALRMSINVLQTQFDEDDTGKHEATEHMRNLVDMIIQGSRDVCATLRPTVLDLGLIPALEWLTARVARHTGLRCHLWVSPSDIDVAEQQSLAIFRVVQESMTNAARHAKADRIDVTVRSKPEALHIEVKDNGVGFDIQKVSKENTFGLVGMQERARAVGAEVRVASKQGRGTSVRMRMPLA
jgi:PAS domain S-box-containing protein